MTTPPVHHDPVRHLFEIAVDGHTAHLEYREKQGLMTILHTIVPSPLGGQGLGAVLVDAALAHAQSSGLQVASECWYATRRIEAVRAAGDPPRSA
ncbi:MAG: GNAT family N-acetyltransferase [Luteimonas sp.]